MLGALLAVSFSAGVVGVAGESSVVNGWMGPSPSPDPLPSGAVVMAGFSPAAVMLFIPAAFVPFIGAP